MRLATMFNDIAFLVRVCLRWFPALVSDCLYMPQHCVFLFNDIGGTGQTSKKEQHVIQKCSDSAAMWIRAGDRQQGSEGARVFGVCLPYIRHLWRMPFGCRYSRSLQRDILAKIEPLPFQ